MSYKVKDKRQVEVALDFYIKSVCACVCGNSNSHQYCPKENLTIPNVKQVLDLQTSKHEEQNEWSILYLREGILSMSFSK